MLLPPEQLKNILLTEKLATEETYQQWLKESEAEQKPLQDYVIGKGIVSDQKMGELVAKQLNVPFIDLSRQQIAEEVVNLIPERIARKEKMLAFARDEKTVSVAMATPGKNPVLDLLAKKTGQSVGIFYATENDIDKSLQMYRKDLQKIVDALLKDDSTFRGDGYDDPPVAKIVDALMGVAYHDKASDIHIEPQEDAALVRFRIDGVLHDVLTVTKYLHDRIVTRIKVMSSLRTDEHLSAQDGKLQIALEEEDLDVRVSIIPIVEGEKVVMRLLSSKMRQFTLSDLGMNEKDLEKVTKAFSRSFGMVLSTGPTGSGKTTSIYSILKILNTREKNLTTVEDPVEYRIKGANQVQVNVKTNLTFANGLRSLLRQDPNIIFVGEIRDSETAGIAVNAALTGHLVFSTLHTNDAATAIPRLVDMKVEPFLVASTVNLIIAQRLVRKICDTCRTSHTVTMEELAKSLPTEIIEKHYTPVGKDKEIRMYTGKGCKTCHMTGYLGRIGVYEVLEVTKGIRELIAQQKGTDEIIRQAIKEGMNTMLDDGLQKVAKGMTTIEEVLRVTKTEAL